MTPQEAYNIALKRIQKDEDERLIGTFKDRLVEKQRLKRIAKKNPEKSQAIHEQLVALEKEIQRMVQANEL